MLRTAGGGVDQEGSKTMHVPQRTRYALRAIFELAKRFGQGPVKIAVIAEAQAIPVRFLEVILSQLKQSGSVDSRRGNDGGYFLVRSPETLTVGEVMRFVQGPIRAVGCLAEEAKDRCLLYGDCVFLPMWQKAAEAVSEIYDNTTFRELVEQERQKQEQRVPGYTI